MYMINYTSDDFKKNLKNADTAIIPIGSLEAHGHHLPLGTDIFSPRMFCERIDKIIGNKVWIAPEIPYGQSYDLSIYPGTIHIPSEVMSSYVYHVGKSLYDNGIKKLILFNGHGGNINALNLACEKLMILGLDVAIINWWLDFSNEILTITESQGHGGEDETSVMMYFDESLVQRDKLMKNTRKPTIKVYFKNRGREIFQDALTGDATLATKDKGERILDLLQDKIIELIELIIEGKYYTED